jgi:DNA-directed RNA polymerase subunit RPC12/RpoP
MPSKYTSGKKSIAECDRCGFRYLLKELKKLTIKTKNVNIKVCKTCWEPDQPQLSIGLYPVNDPQAVREPRPDVSYWQSGYSGLQTNIQTGPLVTENGYPSGGSRIIQWGWWPVGGASANDAGLTPNYLTSAGQVGSVTIT